MDELELLKKDWNKDSDEFKTYSEKEIYGMIKKNSISISKTLLFIGILEVCFWFLFYYVDSENGKLFTFNMIFRCILFVVFVGILLLSFFKINNEKSAKKLMNQILNLRKTIISYVFIMFLSVIIFNIIDFKESANDVVRGWAQGVNEANGHDIVNAKDINPWFGYIGFLLTFAVSIVILYYLYKVIYGSFLDKLKSNYKELSKLEESEA